MPGDRVEYGRRVGAGTADDPSDLAADCLLIWCRVELGGPGFERALQRRVPSGQQEADEGGQGN